MKTLLLITLIFSSFSIAGPGSLIPKEDIALLDEYKKNFQPETVVNQCLGSCYLVSGLSLLEKRISKLLGTKVSISTVDFLKEFLNYRFEHHHTNKRTDHGVLDIISGGNAEQVYLRAMLQDIVVVPEMSKFQRFKEAKVISELYEKINEKAHQIKNETKESFGRYSQITQQDIFMKVFEIMELINSTSFQAEFKFLALHSDSLRRHERNLYSYKHKSLSPIYFDQIDSFKNTLQLMLEIMNKNTAVIDADAEKTLKSKFATKVEDFTKFVAPVQSMYKKQMKSDKLEFIKSKDIIFDEVLKRNPVITTKMKWKLKLDGEAYPSGLSLTDVIHSLKVNQPVVISYNVQKMAIDHSGKYKGVHATPLIERKKPNRGNHAALVVDTIRNARGKIIFLVIKNSWGQAAGHEGYNFMHYSIFDQISRKAHHNFSKLTIKEAIPLTEGNECALNLLPFSNAAKYLNLRDK